MQRGLPQVVAKIGDQRNNKLLFVIFTCILIIYIADHRFISAVPLCSADRFLSG